MRDHTVQALLFARRLRSDMSLPEVLLWRQLRARPGGFKFRRQHPVGAFIADFYCDAADVIIEVDGIAHDMGDGPTHDAKRDAWLSRAGKRVVRIAARDVLVDPVAVVNSIVMLLGAAPPPSALRAATSPEGGGSEGTC
jgi:very-short-patch-repair endonuclease